MDYWVAKGYVAPPSQIIGGAWPPFPTPMLKVTMADPILEHIRLKKTVDRLLNE